MAANCQSIAITSAAVGFFCLTVVFGPAIYFAAEPSAHARIAANGSTLTLAALSKDLQRQFPRSKNDMRP